jgi:hypothetical protein
MCNKKGFAILGIVITIAILGAMGTGVAALVASNHKSRIQHFHADQAYYSSHAALEFGRKQSADKNNQSSYTRQLLNETLLILRVEDKIKGNVEGKGGASASFEMLDPNPPGGVIGHSTCLIVDQSPSHYDAGFKRIQDILVKRDATNPICNFDLSIVSMTISWQPDMGQLIDRIQFDAMPREFYDLSNPLPSGSLFDFGNNDFIISDNNDHYLDNVRWTANIRTTDIFFTFHLIDGSFKTVEFKALADDQANCFSVDSNLARLEWSGGWTKLKNMTYHNHCLKPVRLSKTTVTGSPTAPLRSLSYFFINNINLYGAWTQSNLGIQRDINHTIAGSTTLSDDNRLHFNHEVFGRDFFTEWVFTDDTTSSTAIHLFANNQNDCLDINVSNATMGGVDNRFIQGLTLQNTCTQDIGIMSATVSWSGSRTRQKFQRIDIGDDTLDINYVGNRSSGQVAYFQQGKFAYLRNEAGILNIDILRFRDPIDAGLIYTIEFEMQDGSTKAAQINLGASSINIVIDTSSAVLGGGNDKLQNIIVTNAGTDPMTWTDFQVSWNGSANRRINEVSVESSIKWRGSLRKDRMEPLDTSVILPPAQSKTISFIDFNGNMAGKTFNLTLGLSDKSTVESGSFTP